MIVFPTNHSAGYAAQSVRLNGTDNNVSKATELTGNADAKVGTFSCWINYLGGDGTARTVFMAPGGNFKLAINASNRYSITGYQSGLKLALTSATAWEEADNWHHIGLAWDLATPEAHMFINGSDDEASSTEINSTVDYTGGGFYFGSSSNPHEWVDADVADPYLNLAEFVDISNAAELQKFRTSGGKPVDLEADGSGPTGSAPIFFLTGDVATWHENKGAGGGMTEGGTLLAGASSPSD